MATPPLGHRLAALRTAAGVDQQELARRALALPSGDARQEAEELAELIAWGEALAGSFIRNLLTEAIERVQVLLDRWEARRLFGTLQGCTEAERRTLVGKGWEYRNWALCPRLCAASVEAAADSAERALEWARLALAVAQRVEKEDPAWQGKLRAFALAHVANAERVQCQVRAAEARWEEAEPLWQAGAAAYPGRLDEAQWLSLKASLRIEQRRLAEALELVQDAEAVDRGGLAVNLGLKKGRILECMGSYDQAIATLRVVGAQLEKSAGPTKLLLLQRHNLAVNLCHAGRPAEAADLLPEIQRLSVERGDALASRRVRWLEGRVAMGLGRRAEARSILESVRSSWLELGNAYEMALVSLELAAIYLEEGRSAEVKALAPQLVPVFRAEDGHEEEAKVVGLFCEGVRQELATAELAHEIVAFLYRAWHDPALRFELAGSEDQATARGRRARARRQDG